MRRGPFSIVKHLVLIIGLLAFAGCIKSDVKEASADLFSRGNHAYRSGEYKEAIGFYEDILKKKIASWEVYYNLGNAYYKDGRLGMAVLNYERAFAIAPRDADLRANLKFARSRIANWSDEKTGIWPWRIFPHLDQLMIDEIAWMCLALLVLTCAGILIGVVRRWPLDRWIVFGFIAVILLAYHLTALTLKYQARQSQAIVITTTEAKFEPDARATTHYTLWEGWKVKWLKESSGWVKIERPDGAEGWVPKAAVERINPA